MQKLICEKKPIAVQAAIMAIPVQAPRKAPISIVRVVVSPSATAVMMTIPTPSAVNRPFADTVATLGSDDVHVKVLPNSSGELQDQWSTWVSIGYWQISKMMA